jgi:nitrogen fixation NifU-like protein
VDGVIEDARFEGSGCAISTASASLMTDALKGKSEAQVEALFAGFHALVAGGDDSPPAVALGKLEVLAGVREFPVRVKCATLAWHTLLAALHEVNQPVSTE